MSIPYLDIDSVSAATINDEVYSIYDDYGTLLFQQEGVEVGDMYMGKDYVKYIVVSINEYTMTGQAKAHKVMKKPCVEVKDGPDYRLISNEKKNICLYMTHNDESYLISDGYDSIYGNGGIYDVAKAFKHNLDTLGINTVLDNTLHIPHDNSAYSRSNVTATSLFKRYSPDAMFDIHRDAASRTTYLATVNGINRGMIRIVIGLSNPYMEENEEFAMYLMSVADSMYPWLFKDIYYGKGHYNQAISSKCLLFEMGCHLIEKEYEIESTKPLAEVINVALYNTTVNEDSGNLTINGDKSNSDTSINDALEDYDNNREDIVIEDVVIEDKIEDISISTQESNKIDISYILFGTIVIMISGIAVISTLCITKDYIKSRKKK